MDSLIFMVPFVKKTKQDHTEIKASMNFVCFQQSTIDIYTFGTSFVYEYEGRIASNCHYVLRYFERNVCLMYRKS